MPTRSPRLSGAPAVARCMSIAQRTAATALENSTMSPVAGRLDLAARVLLDHAAQSGEVLATHGIGGVVAAAAEQRRRPDEVGEEDRDEGLLHASKRIIVALGMRVIPAGEGGSPAGVTTSRLYRRNIGRDD